MKDLEKFLYAQIPLTRALGVEVIAVDASEAVVQIPFEPNKNHLGTVFGGSLNTALIVVCYTWLYQFLQSKGLPCHIVISTADTKFLKAVTGSFEARCMAPSQSALDAFLKAAVKKRAARIVLKASVGTACTFQGEFVAQPMKSYSLK